MRRLTLITLVTLLVAYALATLYASASNFWRPQGTLGMTVDYGVAVRFVAPDGPAARAGIVPGDGIDIAAVPFHSRRYVAGVNDPVPIGRVVDLVVVHDGAARPVRLVSVPTEISQAIDPRCSCSASAR